MKANGSRLAGLGRLFGTKRRAFSRGSHTRLRTARAVILMRLDERDAYILVRTR